MIPPAGALSALHLPDDGWTPLSGGMNAVWRRGDLVLKRVTDPDEATAERLLLTTAPALPVPIPAWIGAADHEGATWQLTSWLPGERLSQVWASLDHPARTAVAETLGHTLAALWATPVTGLQRAPLRLAERPAQIEAAAQRHLLPADVLGELAGSEVLDEDCVVTHADLHGDQVLMTRDARGWRVSGLLDFGDATLAPRHYDLVSPFCDLLGPDQSLREVMVDAAGLHIDAGWDRRMTALALLHPWIDVPRLLSPDLTSLSAWLSARPPHRRGPA